MGFLNPIEKKISQKWIIYNLVLVIVGVFIFPAATLTRLNTVIYSTAAVYLILLLPYDAKFLVGENDPATFLKVERLKNDIYKLSLLFLASALALFFLTLILGILKVDMAFLTIPFQYLTNAVLYGFTGTWFFSFTIFVYFPRRFEFAKLQAKTRLVVFLGSLPEDRKTIRKNIGIFRDGLERLNSVFIQNFDFAIKEPKRFYDYVKLMVFSLDDIAKKQIQDGLKILIAELPKKDPDPFKILCGLRQIVGKPTKDKKILLEETESEHGLYIWLRHNLKILLGFVGFVSELIIIIGFLIGR